MTDRVRTCSGTFGILAIPEPEKAVMAEELANRYAKDAEYRVTAERAHITLYQARLRDVPESLVSHLVNALNEEWCGSHSKMLHVQFEGFSVYPGKFLFWNAKPSCSLLAAHYAATALVAFFDRRSAIPVPSPLLSKPEQDNCYMFGTPLIGPEYLPHVTLAADAVNIYPPTAHVKDDAYIDRIVFARMGTWGTIDEIIL